jgi:preprotein translocase subunit SecF
MKAAVDKFPIAELKDMEKEKALMQSLQKGNVQSVTIEKDGSSHKMFIEADPQYKKINLYDSNMKMVTKESIDKYQSVGSSVAKNIKEEMSPDKKKELKQEVKPNKERLEKKNDKTLLPKKRESVKKGLGVS